MKWKLLKWTVSFSHQNLFFSNWVCFWKTTAHSNPLHQVCHQPLHHTTPKCSVVVNLQCTMHLNYCFPVWILVTFLRYHVCRSFDIWSLPVQSFLTFNCFRVLIDKGQFAYTSILSSKIEQSWAFLVTGPNKSCFHQKMADAKRTLAYFLRLSSLGPIV